MPRPPKTPVERPAARRASRRIDAKRPVLAALEQARQPELRRDGDRHLPAGPKARRTRAQLLEAASELFAEQGYQATSVAAIVERVGVSFGTFYQYFRDRSDILAALVTDHVTGIVERTDARWEAGAGRDGLYRMISGFVAGYAASAALSGVWEEACHVDPTMAALRRDLSRVLTDGVERRLLQGGRAGQWRRFTPRDAALAARALAGMVDRFCFVSYVFDPPADGPLDPDEAARLLTTLWAGAIGLHTGE